MSITLELIADGGASATPKTLLVSMEDYVQNRVEHFRYKRDVKANAIALDYIEFLPLSPERNLQIVDKSYGVAANAPRMTDSGSQESVSVTRSFSSQYDKVLITDRTVLGSDGSEVPLYYMHRLPENTVRASLSIQRSDGYDQHQEGISFDYEAGRVFTNYRNYFNSKTGAYALYFIQSEDSAGVSTNTLLNAEPAAPEAGWRDIDPDTGRLYDSSPTYSKSRNSSGFTFYMSYGSRWWRKPMDRSQLRPVIPAVREADNPWYLRTNVAIVNGLVNGSQRSYSLPEYDTQPFAPYKPYIYSNNSETWFVTRNVLKTIRPHLGVHPDDGLHASVFVKDHNGNLLFAFTTNGALSGLRFSDTDVKWNSDAIASWDNPGGFIHLAFDLDPSWTVDVQAYYNTVDFEVTKLDLNPGLNPRVADKLVVFYVVPDVSAGDDALHYLIVGSNGEILECSQGVGATHPNLQMTDGLGAYNYGTAIGTLYSAVDNTNTFLGLYAAGYDNLNAYLILSEVVVTEQPVGDDYFVVGVRKQGARPVNDAVLLRNPRIQQSYLAGHEDGMIAPRNKAFIIEAQLSLLEDYGGVLTKVQAEERLLRHLDASVYPVIRWVYPATQLSATSVLTGEVDLSWTYEGPVDSLIIYRKDSLQGTWVSLHVVASPTDGDISYTDATAVTTQVYHYGIALVEDGQEFPIPNSVSIKVL